MIQQLKYASTTGSNVKNPSVETYSDLAAAVASLANNGSSFNGVVSAALNDNGTAKWIVPYSTTAAIAVTSKSGSYGAPKAGDELQIYISTDKITKVRIVIDAGSTTVNQTIDVKQGLNTTNISVGKGVKYTVIDWTSGSAGTTLGSGTGE